MKYVRASSDQNDFSRLQKEDFTISNSKIRFLARRNATLNHDKFKWGIAGLRGCGTLMIGAVAGEITGGFPGLILGAIGGFLMPFSTANSFNPNIIYPPEVKGLDEKRLYKETYLKQARILAKESMKNGPGLALLAGGAFLILVNL